ncbi:MAG: hypothetical protein HOQ01_03255 [Lysobacter sp.]|nr:hypothetical protein [Lysobacter sp.]
MTEVSRRTLLKGIAAAPFVYAVAPRAFAAAGPRADIATPAGEEMLAIYADAVRKMKALTPDNHLSWTWWWYQHFTDGRTSKNAEITRIFGATPSTMRTNAVEMWNTCQPHSGQNPHFFLPWHRMYTYYLERVVRQITGRADFSMPYWHYCSDDPAQRGVLPPQFRLPDDPVWGVLYKPNRRAIANAGQPIQMNEPSDPMDISSIMSKEKYENVGADIGFCRAMDSGIHGRIHVLTGTSVGMGGVPYAADDPLFAVHHATVDRMWASWNRNGGKNPTDTVAFPWLNTQFAMMRENGTRVALRSTQLWSIQTMGYAYDSYVPRPVAPPAAPASTTTTMAKLAAKSPLSTKVAASDAMATLGATATTVRMLRVSTAKQTEVLGLDTDGRKAFLVMRKLHAWKQPGVLYHVYLCASPTAPLDASAYVGNINFFDAEFHDHGGANSKLDTALGENFYSWDVTAHLRNMAKRKVGSSAREMLFVKVVPSGKPDAAAKPMIAQMELIRQ